MQLRPAGRSDANKLLGRAATRRTEFGVRLAIGANRIRLVRQLLTESLMIAAIGGCAGFIVARAITRTLPALLPPEAGLDNSFLRPDARVVAFTSALCLLTTIVFGLAPALRAASQTARHPCRRSGCALYGLARGRRAVPAKLGQFADRRPGIPRGWDRRRRDRSGIVGRPGRRRDDVRANSSRDGRHAIGDVGDARRGRPAHREQYGIAGHPGRRGRTRRTCGFVVLFQCRRAKVLRGASHTDSSRTRIRRQRRPYLAPSAAMNAVARAPAGPGDFGPGIPATDSTRSQMNVGPGANRALRAPRRHVSISEN